MWFALRHVRSGRTRFTLFAALVALVSGLIMLLTGLGLGLGDASISGMNQVDADAVVEQNGVRLSIGRSLVDLSTVERRPRLRAWRVRSLWVCTPSRCAEPIPARDQPTTLR